MASSEKKPRARKPGRGLFYHRDSGGKHEQTPAQYLNWAKKRAKELKVSLQGTPQDIVKLVKDKVPNIGDIFFDYCVSGNLLSRPALDALKAEIERDRTVSHLFIPRRDRLARPDDALDGTQLENDLRRMGVTLVFMDRTLAPLKRGERQDIGEAIAALVAYDGSGRYRDELAEKMIFAQLQLAKLGYSTGGTAPYGFRRWLISVDGKPIRQLAEGESVRRKGHHVVWLPEPDTELDLIRRILKMLETLTARRVAQILTLEGIPSPGAGKYRTDNGVVHQVSGVWHPNTVTNIARNPLLRATTSYGRRSMGDRRRVTPDGPREMVDDDYQNDESGNVSKTAKVIRNPKSQHVSARAHFEPLITKDQADRLNAILDKRGGKQKDKPRTRNPEKNPLGCRVFDLACGWPMYRQDNSGKFLYKCGLYQQSHGESCEHNHIDGLLATKFALAAVRHMLQGSVTLDALATRIRERVSARPDRASATDMAIAAKRQELLSVTAEIDIVSGNLARAKNDQVFYQIETVLMDLNARQAKLEEELAELASAKKPSSIPADNIQRALELVSRLPKLLNDANSLSASGSLFQKINLQMFLRFQPVALKKRTVNRLSGGILTIGAADSPIKKYTGPTGRRGLQGRLSSNKTPAGGPVGAKKRFNTGKAAKSLGNRNRDDRI